jgi:hypothetical protein
MGPKALGTSDAGSQHPPGGVSDCRPTTTRVGGAASRASSIPGSARYSWLAAPPTRVVVGLHSLNPPIP